MNVWWVSIGFLIWYFHFFLFVYRSNAHFLFYLLFFLPASNQFIAQTLRVNSNRNCFVRFYGNSTTCLVIFSFKPSFDLNNLSFIIIMSCQTSPILLKHRLTFNKGVRSHFKNLSDSLVYFKHEWEHNFLLNESFFFLFWIDSYQLRPHIVIENKL